jgi:biopolymer transport protein ExbB
MAMGDHVQTALDYLRQGGWVMVPLAAVSVALWTLIIERFVEYRALASRHNLLRRLTDDYERKRLGRLDLDRAVLRVSARRLRGEIERYLAIITMLVAIAPLLGLLGTVLGMTETFQVIAIFGTGNTRALASGVSVALITTQTGLLIAVPGLFLRGRLRAQAEALSTRLDELVTVLDRRLQADAQVVEVRS